MAKFRAGSRRVLPREKARNILLTFRGVEDSVLEAGSKAGGDEARMARQVLRLRKAYTLHGSGRDPERYWVEPRAK